MTDIKVSGLRQIAEDFEKIPVNLGGAVVKAATWKACEVIMFEMIRRAPYLKAGRGITPERIKKLTKSKGTESHIPGQLQNSIKRFHLHTDFPSSQAKVAVGPTVYYARFVEFGHNPSAPPHPFIGPAFDASIENAIDELKVQMGKAIDRTLKKYGWN